MSRTCPNGHKASETRICGTCIRNWRRIVFPPQRFDFAPLESIAGERLTKAMSGSMVKRYREQGMLAESADRWACRMGYHPSELWGDLWWGLFSEETT